MSENLFSSLIRDRSSGDVARKTAKGFYNYTDLNRVGEAVGALALLLSGLGYKTVVNPKTDWGVNDIPKREDGERYMENLHAVNRLRYAASPAPLPSIERLNYTGANNIEDMLYQNYLAIGRIQDGWYYSGEIYGGDFH